MVKNELRFDQMVENIVRKMLTAISHLSTMFSLVFCHRNVVTPKDVKTLLDMPSLGSFNSAANKDMKSKIWTNGYNYLTE